MSIRKAVLSGLLLVAAACGDDSPGSPAGPTGSPGPSGATITIGANGAVSPSSVTITRGQSVTFINSHNAVHDMVSDPHPAHTDCRELNAVGLIQPGQTRLTNALPTARTCGFHDHANDTNANLRGTIVIQ
jgi:plastocyanin